MPGDRDPVVHLYAVCWNEAAMLPFFFRHYAPWVQRFVIYDNGSTDGTLELLSARPDVEVREFPWSDLDSFVTSHRTLHNSCWRESRGAVDWVVVAAIDEHLHHPALPMQDYLRACMKQGVTCVPALGYQMVTQDFPKAGEDLSRKYTHGVPQSTMNKLRLFRPDVVEPHIGIGGHGASPTGHVVYPPRDELLLLHYKDLGVEYRDRRNRLLVTGLRSGDHANGWGWHYRMDRAGLEGYFAYLKASAVDVAAPDYVPWRDNTEPRFWRPSPQPAPLRPKRRLWKRLKKALRRIDWIRS